MDIIKVKFLIFLLTIYLVQTEKCPVYKCGDLPANECKETKTTNTTGINYVLHECEQNKRCPIYTSGDKLTCEPISNKQIKLYPGSPCKTSDECITSLCDQNFCVGPKDDCKNDHSNCEFGKACFQKEGIFKCDVLLEEGKSCVSDYECRRNLGCFSGVCTKYYSVDDGQKVPNDLNKRAPYPITLCKSGYELEGICHSLSLQNERCTDTETCKYTKKSDSTTVEIKENCECGYNNDGEKYCKIGSTDALFQKYIEKTYAHLSDADKCNTLERNGACNHYKTFPEEKFNYLFQNYTNSFIMAENAHILKSVDNCILNVTFPDYNNSTDWIEPISRKEPKCAKYACETNTDNVCALGKFNKDENTSHVSLNDICKSDQFCSVKADNPWYIFTNTTDKDVKGDCKALSEKINLPPIRYPGEACNENKDCYVSQFDDKTGKCENKICSGLKENDKCTETAQCFIGTSCQNNTCLVQLEENKVCTNTYECVNNMVCYEGKCSKKYYSLPLGSKSDNPLLCEYNYVHNGVCSSVNSTDIKDSKSADLVKCDFGQMCNYTHNGIDAFTKSCECGYNSDGNGYCPRGHDTVTDKWKTLYANKVKNFDNKCHSMSRDLCYLTETYKFTSQFDQRRETELSHLYYNSVKCASRVLSGGYVNISIFIILAIIAFII